MPARLSHHDFPAAGLTSRAIWSRAIGLFASALGKAAMAALSATLVVGPRWVGDMVMAQCLFKALKRLDPDRPIDVLAPAWAAPLVERMPEIRGGIAAPFQPRALELGLRWQVGRALAGRYDRAYVLPGSWKAALLPLFAGIGRRIGYCRELRYGLLNDIRPLPAALKRRTALMFQALADDGPLLAPALTVDPVAQARLLERWQLTDRGFVALMPGAEFGPAKRWPAASYAAFANRMADQGLACVTLGSAGDRAVGAEIAARAPGAVNLCGQTQLAEVVDLLAAARLAVTNDSGLMHVAAAVATPLVAIYGSTSADNTPPLSANAELVSLRLPCSPCHRKVCPLGHADCLGTLEVERVVAAARRLGVG
jgi:heptosyltransferase-2